MPFDDELTMYEALHEPPAEVDEWAKKVIGAAIEVHKYLAAGHLESSYEEALAYEFELRGIPFRRQAEAPLFYKGRPVGQGKMDFIVADVLVIEIKAVLALLPIHRAQIMAYLAATNLMLGLLLNFNVPLLKNGIVRVIRS